MLFIYILFESLLISYSFVVPAGIAEVGTYVHHKLSVVAPKRESLGNFLRSGTYIITLVVVIMVRVTTSRERERKKKKHGGEELPREGQEGRRVKWSECPGPPTLPPADTAPGAAKKAEPAPSPLGIPALTTQSSHYHCHVPYDHEN